MVKWVMKIAVTLLERSRLCPGCTCGEGMGISRAQPPESPGLAVVPYLTSLSLPPASSAEAGRSGRKTRKKRGGEGNRRQKTAPSWTRAWNSGKHPFPFIRRLTSPVYPPVWVNLVPASEDSWEEAPGPLDKLGDGHPNALPPPRPQAISLHPTSPP